MKLTSRSWIKLPLALKQLPGITKAAADVGAVIIHQCAKAEPCEISTSEIAKAICCDRKTVTRSVAALVAVNLIELEYSTGRRSGYRLTHYCRELCASALRQAESHPHPYAAKVKPTVAAMTAKERAEMEQYLSLVNRFEIENQEVSS